MNVFVLSNTSRFKNRKLLGMTPDNRLLFQIKAAGVQFVTVLTRQEEIVLTPPASLDVSVRTAGNLHANLKDFVITLSTESDEPILIFDGDAIFQKDFAAKALACRENTIFLADGRVVAAARFDDAPYREKDASASAADIRSAQGVKAAHRMLIDGLRKPMLVDGIVGYYIMRPITLRITSLIVNTPIRPNHVTAFCMLLGLAGAGMVAAAGVNAWMMQLGIFLYFVGATLDCVDGEMARLKYAGSYSGAWFDTISDDLSTAALLLAMGWYQAQITGSMMWMLMGLSAAVLFMLGEIYTYYYLVTIYHSGDVLDFQWAAGVKKKATADTFADYFLLIGKRDFFSFALVVLALIGAINVGLVWLSIMMYIFAVYVLADIVLSLKRPGWRKESLKY